MDPLLRGTFIGGFMVLVFHVRTKDGTIPIPDSELEPGIDPFSNLMESQRQVAFCFQ